MIRRRKALKNIGLITGGVLTLPYNCSFETQISYSNFPLLKKKEQDFTRDYAITLNLGQDLEKKYKT